MSNPTVSDKAIKRLLTDVKLFANMTSAQKAAFRARVSRYLGIVSDDNGDQYDATLTDILTAVQDKVGKSAVRKSKKLTPQDIIDEYNNDGVDVNDTRKLGAFRAKAKRLMNRLDDQTAVADIQAILDNLDQQEADIRRQSIINMAMKAGLIDSEEEDSTPE